MDRNWQVADNKPLRATVALRKESVDRNYGYLGDKEITTQSLSARRAWIEISITPPSFYCSAVALRKESVDRNIWQSLYGRWWSVALRKESVDRNKAGYSLVGDDGKSLSARRAWIEMLSMRNPSRIRTGRSPQGERG